MLNSGPALLFALTGSQIKRWQVVSHSVARCANSFIFRFSSTKAIHSTREEKHRETLTSISSIAGFYFSVDCRRFAHRELKFASRWRNRRAFKSLTELSKMNLFYKTSVPVHACARARQFQYRVRRDLITWNALSWTVLFFGNPWISTSSSSALSKSKFAQSRRSKIPVFAWRVHRAL